MGQLIDGFDVEVKFETTEPLDTVEQRLRAADVTIAQPTTDDGFGRQLQVSAPDGLLIKSTSLNLTSTPERGP